MRCALTHASSVGRHASVRRKNSIASSIASGGMSTCVPAHTPMRFGPGIVSNNSIAPIDRKVLVARHVEHQHLAMVEATRTVTDERVPSLVLCQAAEGEHRAHDRRQVGDDCEPEHRAHREARVSGSPVDARVACARGALDSLPVVAYLCVVHLVRQAARDVALEQFVGRLRCAPVTVAGTVHQRDRGRNVSAEALGENLHDGSSFER